VRSLVFQGFIAITMGDIYKVSFSSDNNLRIKVIF
jgi:hypothetical protein